MPRADGAARETWDALPDDERDDVYAAWQMDGVRRRRLEILRESQWIFNEARNGERAEVFDAAFDDLEVAR